MVIPWPTSGPFTIPVRPANRKVKQKGSIYTMHPNPGIIHSFVFQSKMDKMDPKKTCFFSNIRFQKQKTDESSSIFRLKSKMEKLITSPNSHFSIFIFAKLLYAKLSVWAKGGEIVEEQWKGTRTGDRRLEDPAKTFSTQSEAPATCETQNVQLGMDSWSPVKLQNFPSNCAGRDLKLGVDFGDRFFFIIIILLLQTHDWQIYTKWLRCFSFERVPFFNWRMDARVSSARLQVMLVD